MTTAAPKNLAEVATRADIPEAELGLYDAADFDDLLKELGISVTVRVRLKKQHRDLLGGQAPGNAQPAVTTLDLDRAEATPVSLPSRDPSREETERTGVDAHDDAGEDEGHASTIAMLAQKKAALEARKRELTQRSKTVVEGRSEALTEPEPEPEPELKPNPQPESEMASVSCARSSKALAMELALRAPNGGGATRAYEILQRARRATAAGVVRAAAENGTAKGTLARLQDTSAVTIQKRWRGIEGRSRVSAQIEMELLALQVEAEVEAENDTTDDSADETMSANAAAARTESEVLFEQIEAKVEAEVAAELLQQQAAAAAVEEDEEDGAYLTVKVPDGSGPGDELVLQVEDGMQFAVVIPDGLSPGDEFAVDERDWLTGEQQAAAHAAKQEELLVSSVPPQNTPAATSLLSEDEELPSGWSAHLSSAGERYYYNEDSGASTFTRPSYDADGCVPTEAAADGPEDNTSEDEAEDEPPQNNREEPPSGGSESEESSSLPEGWEVAVSRSTGQRYFVNSLTQDTTYDRPAMTALETVLAELPTGWSARMSRSTGELFYISPDGSSTYTSPLDQSS